MRRRNGTSAHTQLRSRAAPQGLPDKLPLVHVTAVGIAREIVTSGQLETRECPIFKKKLLYFFALRPAYRSKDNHAKSDKINYFPFVFIVKPDAVETPYHVYPFDSGGAAKGVFDEQADSYEHLEDYELEPNHTAVAGQIGWAFGSLKDYFDGTLRNNLLEGVPQHETLTRSYVDIAQLAASGSNRPDKRASAVEVACAHHIPLQGNVELVILPKQYLEEEGPTPNTDFIQRLTNAGIAWEVYDWQPNKTPDKFQDEIASIVQSYYQKKGLL